MLDIYTWSVLITAIFFTSFGLFAYVRNSKEASSKLFALLSLSFAMWSSCWFALLTLSDEFSKAVMFSRLLALGSTFIPIFYTHWALTVVDLQVKRKAVLVLGYIVTIFFALISFTEFYIPGVRNILFFKYWPVAGPGYSLFIIFGYLGLVGYSMFELFRSFGKAAGEKKYQIGYLITGSLLGFGGGATNFPLMYGQDFMQPFGLFFVMASPFVFSYAAVRYKLMNVRVVATQFFLGAINVVFLINLILSDSNTETFFNTLLLLVVFYFTFLSIRGVRREVNQREKIEKLANDLSHANERLTELDKLKSEFVSLATHQIRGPVSAIKGYASLMLEGDYGVIPRSLEKPIETVYESSKSLAVIVDDFLNVSRIEQGKMKYDYSVFDLCALIKDTCSELKPIITKKGLELYVSNCSDAVMVRADIGKIKQVISNIVDNSVKYTPSGKIEIDLQVKEDRKKVVVTISDTGVGIRAETIPHLFKKFSRSEDASKVNILGTGLGLYVAKEMIEAQGGRIWVESEGEGKGSSFFVELSVA